MSSTHQQSPLTLFTCPSFTASFSLNPTTPLQIDLHLPSPLSSLELLPFTQTFLSIRQLSLHLLSILSVPRWALSSNGDGLISLKPLHGVDPLSWGPIMPEKDLEECKMYKTKFPGWVMTRNAPMWTEEEMVAIMEPLREVSGLTDQKIDLRPDDEATEEDNLDPTSSSSPRTHRQIPHEPSNLFARIIKGQMSNHKFFETSSCIAFLTPFPFTAGSACVIPRKQWRSDILALPPKAFELLIKDSWEAIQIVKKAFGIERCAMFFEGYEINWSHFKLFPIWDEPCHILFKDERLAGRRKDMPEEGEGRGKEWSGNDVKFGFQEKYEGYLTSQTGDRVSDAREKELSELAGVVREELAALKTDA